MLLRALILGAVQGFTEFVPVSSSAHLVLVPFVLGWEAPGLPFDVALHLGTAVALIAYFRRELWGIVTGTIRTLAGRAREPDREHARLAGLLVIGSIPAGAAGLLFKGFFEDLFGAPQVVALLLLGTAALLFGAEAVYRRRAAEARDISRIGIGDAVAIGLLQAIAIAPGISRSGSTIAAGLFRGLARDAAARFSFLLGLPAILGAAAFQVPRLGEGDVVLTLAGAAVAAVTGFAAIALLLRHLRTKDTKPFAWYCVFVGVVAFGFWLQVK